MFDATQPRTIPVGILVSVTDSSCKRAQRIIRPRKPVSPVPWRSPLPWREVLVAVSAVWLVLVVGVALWAGSSTPAPAPAQEIAVAAVPASAPAADVAAPVAVELADLAATAPEPEPTPLLDRLPSVPASVALPVSPTPRPVPPVAPDVPKSCTARLGTPIDFVVDPPEAFRRAKAENKLVFMIHLSGNFEDQEFT